MTAGGIGGGGGGVGGVNVSALEAKAAAAKASAAEAAEETAETSLLTDVSDVVNPAAAARASKKSEKFTSLESRKKEGAQDTKDTKIKGIEEKQEEDLADKHAQDNTEVTPESLRDLRSKLSPDSTAEDVIALVESVYTDPTLAMTALEFLEASVPNSEGALKQAVIMAKNQHLETHKQSITAGKNILFASQLFAQSMNVSPGVLRSVYSDVTTNMYSCKEMFSKLSTSYTSLDEMSNVAKFLLKGMGNELKSQGASIEPAQLVTLVSEVRTLQAVLGVQGLFQSSMPRLQKMFNDDGASFPQSITPQSLTESYHTVVSEKFLTPSKLEKEVFKLVSNSSDAEAASSCVLNLFSYAVRQTSPRLFISMEHRQQLLTTMGNTLDMININNEDYPKPGVFPRKSPFE